MKLTAEQVREAVNGHGNIMDNRLYCDWQAIADALNAELGIEPNSIKEQATCVMDETESWTAVCKGHPYDGEQIVVHVMECDECGKEHEHVNGSYPHCPHCGRKVVEQ